MKSFVVALFLFGCLCLAQQASLHSMKAEYLGSQSAALNGRSAGAHFMRGMLGKLESQREMKTILLPTFSAHDDEPVSSKRVLVIVNRENVDVQIKVAEALASQKHTVQLLVVDPLLQVSTSLLVERVQESELSTLGGSEALKAAWLVQQHLSLAAPFDVVVSSHGDAYYAMLAKAETLAFEDTVFVYALLSAHNDKDVEAHHLADMFEKRFMAHRQVVLADKLWSPTPRVQLFHQLPMEKAVFLPVENVAMWGKFVGSLTLAVPSVMTGKPLVTVCMVHFNRPALLLQAIDSVLQQTYKQTQLVLVDNGSTDPEVASVLANLESRFPRGWTVVRSKEQLPVAAAKNLAVESATGEFVFFLDDDNYLKPEALETLVLAAQATGADILTTPFDMFKGEQTPLASIRTWLPLGASLAVGLVRNCYGDSNFLVRREMFNNIGGFTEEKAGESGAVVSGEDHEFFASAILSGKTLEVVPSSLLWKRLHSSSQLTYISSGLMKNLRALRPYAQQLGLNDVVKFLVTVDSLAIGDSRMNCTETESACGSQCCNLATHHCDHVEKTCKFNPFNCPADGRHIFCRNVGRCVPIGGIDGHGRSDCGVCGLTCDTTEVCSRTSNGWGCLAAKEVKTDYSIPVPTVLLNEDGSVFVDSDEISVGVMAQGEEKAFPAPEFDQAHIQLTDDEVLEVESRVCLSGLRQGDKFRVHALSTKKAVKAAAVNVGGTDLTSENNCANLVSASPVRSIALQRIGSPRRVDGRSLVGLKMNQTARKVRSTDMIATTAAVSSSADTKADAGVTQVVTVVNFNFAGMIPLTICSTKTLQ